MHTLHLSRRAALACSLAVLASAPAVAQEASYPSKPSRSWWVIRRAAAPT